jgi:hypothetical protein
LISRREARYFAGLFFKSIVNEQTGTCIPIWILRSLYLTVEPTGCAKVVFSPL